MAVKTLTNLTPGTHKFSPSHTWVILTYTAGDLDNTDISSSTPGVPVSIAWPGSPIASGSTFTDVDASGGSEIDASDGTCTDGGGNTNIDFGVGVGVAVTKMSLRLETANWIGL